jgi:hypothetical protein
MADPERAALVASFAWLAEPSAFAGDDPNARAPSLRRGILRLHS